MNEKPSDLVWRSSTKYTAHVGRYMITIEKMDQRWAGFTTIFHWRVRPMFNNILVDGGGQPSLYKAQQAALDVVEKAKDEGGK